MKRSRWKCLMSGGILLLLLSSVVQAEILNLTTTTTSGAIAEAIFTQTTMGGSGSGQFDPFLRLNSNNPTVLGYNYNQGAIPVATDNPAANDSMTSLLRWNDLAATSIGTTPYIEFALDINESGNAAGALLSLNDFEIWMSPNPTVGLYSGWANDAAMMQVYDLDSNADWAVYLNGNLHQGSGVLDMFAYVPTDNFIEAWNNAYAEANPYIYVYSRFGASAGYEEDAGFEEWAVDSSRDSPPPVDGVPEPTSFALLPMALAGLALWRRKRS